MFSPRLIACFLLLSPVSGSYGQSEAAPEPAAAEPASPEPAAAAPAAAAPNPALALFERLVPGLKITRLGEAEPGEGGATRFVGDNEFEFTTKGETIRAKAGVVTLDPAKSLVTLSRKPSVTFRSHSLIATAAETRIVYRTDTGKVTALGPHRISIGGLGKKSP